MENIRSRARGDRAYEAILQRENDQNSESKLRYHEFIDLYIKLYYEPLVEDYDEMLYMTKDSDRKLHELIGGRKVRSIEMKLK